MNKCKDLCLFVSFRCYCNLTLDQSKFVNHFGHKGSSQPNTRSLSDVVKIVDGSSFNFLEPLLEEMKGGCCGKLELGRL